MKSTAKTKKQTGAGSAARGRKPRRAETWQDQLFSNSINGIYLYRPWSFILVNEPFCVMLGYSWDELKTISPLDLAAPQHREWVEARVQARLKGKKDESPYEIELVGKGGKVIQGRGPGEGGGLPGRAGHTGERHRRDRAAAGRKSAGRKRGQLPPAGRQAPATAS